MEVFPKMDLRSNFRNGRLYSKNKLIVADPHCKQELRRLADARFPSTVVIVF